jgi:hypothetical protein
MWVGVRAMAFNATFNNASVIFSTISPISTKRTITSKNRKKKEKKRPRHYVAENVVQT